MIDIKRITCFVYDGFLYACFTGSSAKGEGQKGADKHTQTHTCFFVASICQLASCGVGVVIMLSSRLVSVYSLAETGLKLNALLFVQQLCQVPMSQYRRDQLALPS